MRSNPDDLFCGDLPTSPCPGTGAILVTGATGYIGGRLVPELLHRGYHVRVMSRELSPEHRERWPGAEVVKADALQPESLGPALEGIHTAFYLIHPLLLANEMAESATVQAAANFRKTAEEKGISHVIYLGALGDSRTSPSVLLRQRAQVPEELRRSGIPVTALFSAAIIGSGSASYELIEHLVRSCPVLLIPSWAESRCQPVAVRDVIKYLVGLLETPGVSGRTFEIGGADVLSLREMLTITAQVLCRKKLLLRAPIEHAGMYAYLASLLTPVPMQICRCLLEYWHGDLLCRDQEIRRIVPFRLLGYREALVRALSREEQDRVYTRWSDAYPPDYDLAMKLHELDGLPTYQSSYSLVTDKDASALFRSICRIGGREGWFNSNWLWRIRGAFDRMLLGVGTSRGRKSATSLEAGDVIDFWRVEDYRVNERLLLRAEMKLPGRAWLEFRIDQLNGRNSLSVTAYYQTKGLWGRFYWYVFLPFHIFIFRDLIRQIERTSVGIRTPGSSK
ncbi:MAG: SDR family oxidoreductase [Acidobacteria bacterium]|nr:SDR family oxidoreductase [Acidobacteriota bacterium]